MDPASGSQGAARVTCGSCAPTTAKHIDCDCGATDCPDGNTDVVGDIILKLAELTDGVFFADIWEHPDLYPATAA